MAEFLLALLMFIGVALFLRATYVFLKSWRTTKWISRATEIERVGIVKGTELGLYTRVVKYKPSVEYVYEMGGERYRSSQISVDDSHLWCYSREKAENALRRVTAHGSCLVNPRDWRESVLVEGLLPRSRSHYLALLFAGTALVSVGIFLLVL